MTRFIVPVETLREARLIINTLGNYDAFQERHDVKPDYCNAGGLSIFDDGEWCDYCDEEGRDFDKIPMDELTHDPLAHRSESRTGERHAEEK